jgi:hypothetical protein
MFHHEAIFDFNKGKLNIVHSKAVNLLNALCCDTHVELAVLDRFTQVWDNGQGWKRYRQPSLQSFYL